MKIKEGYLLREVAGSYVVVPTGIASLDFSGVITLNETGAFLWNQLAEGTTEQELITALSSEYDIGEDIARADVLEFASKLKAVNLVE